MDRSIAILNALLDIYDRRGLYAGEDGKRPASTTVQKVFPSYADQYSPDVFREVNVAVDYLITQGFVCAKKDARGYYNRVKLRFDAAPRSYQLCGRTPLGHVREQLHQLVCQISSEHPVLKSFRQAQLQRLKEARPLEHGIGDDPKKLGEVLLALSALTKLDQETYIRNFSEAVFRDSKRFQHIQGSVISILCAYGGLGLTRENALESFNLLANPAYVFLKGQVAIELQNSSISVFDIPGGIAFPSVAIHAVKSITIRGSGIITVENLTAYHDEEGGHDAVLYLGGFHNSIRTQLLKLIYRDNPHKQYSHKGDIDVYGFLILEDLKDKTGIPFHPADMDIETLMEYESHGLVKPLSPAEKRLMHLPQLAKHANVLSYMERNNCKAEQEAREALRLLGSGV